MQARQSILERPVSEFLHHDFSAFPETWTCAHALDEIRRTGDDHKVSYFYTVDDDDRLCGVIPVRRFLTAPTDRLLGEMAIRNLTPRRWPRRPTSFKITSSCRCLWSGPMGRSPGSST